MGGGGASAPAAAWSGDVDSRGDGADGRRRQRRRRTVRRAAGAPRHRRPRPILSPAAWPARPSRSGSSGTPSSSRSTTRASASSTSTWRTSACCSSGSRERLTSTAAREPAAAACRWCSICPAAGHAALLERAPAPGALRLRGGGLRRRRVCGSRRCRRCSRRRTCDRALRALAGDLDGLDRGAGADEALKRIAATMACHAAVKAHDPLTVEKMRHILDELRATAYSTVCPHGRPVMFRISRGRESREELRADLSRLQISGCRRRCVSALSVRP